MGLPEPDVTVGMRTGDTPADERRRLATRPPDVLITTPESLFLLLTSVRPRRRCAGSRRSSSTRCTRSPAPSAARTSRSASSGSTRCCRRPARRIGLSATVRPVDEVARFLCATRDVEVVQPPSDKRIEVEVVVPVDDMTELGTPTGDLSGPAAGEAQRMSIWPHVEERIVDLVEAHRSTIVFANSRRLAERLCARLNEIHTERLLGRRTPTSPTRRAPRRR